MRRGITWYKTETDLVYDVLGEPGRVNGGYIRITTRRVHLTYAAVPPGLPDPGWVVDVLGRQLGSRGYGVGEWSACCELGVCRALVPPRLHPHTHVALEITGREGARFQLLVDGVFRVGGLAPHVRVVKEEAHWRYLFATYHRKEGGPCRRSCEVPRGWVRQGPAAVRMGAAEVAERLARGESEMEILHAADAMGIGGKSASDIGKIIATAKPAADRARNRAALEAELAGTTLRHWQVLWTALRLQAMRNHRLILWFADIIGGTGKSTFAKYLCVMEEAAKALVLRRWDTNGVCLVISDEIEELGSLDTIIFDLSRASRKDSEGHLAALAKVCEEIRDGTITSLKYRSKTIVLPTHPAVFIFANFWPNITDDSDFSADRWLLCIPGAACDIGHVICEPNGAGAVEDAALGVNQAVPRIVDRTELNRALSACVPAGKKNPTARERIEHGFAQLCEVFGLDSLRRYWTAGYEPLITLQEITVKEKVLAARPANGCAPEIVGAEVRVIGNVIVTPSKLTPERQRESLEWLRRRDAGKLTLAEDYRERLALVNRTRAEHGYPPVDRLSTGPPP